MQDSGILVTTAGTTGSPSLSAAGVTALGISKLNELVTEKWMQVSEWMTLHTATKLFSTFSWEAWACVL